MFSHEYDPYCDTNAKMDQLVKFMSIGKFLDMNVKRVYYLEFCEDEGMLTHVINIEEERDTIYLGTSVFDEAMFKASRYLPFDIAHAIEAWTVVKEYVFVYTPTYA